MNPVADLIRERAYAAPSASAVKFGASDVTWQTLYRRACQVANALRAQGVQAGERVAFIDKNGIEFFEFFFGCALCGVVPVPVSWRFTQAELEATIADAQVRVAIVGPEFGASFAAVASRGDGPVFISLGAHSSWLAYEAWLSGQGHTDPHIEAHPGSAVMQLYTSGTTGAPKGALIDARNIQCLLTDCLAQWSHGPTDTSLVCMPLFHMGGVGWALAGMAAGSRSVIVREFVPAQVVDLLESERITIAFFVPAMLGFLCGVPGIAERKFTLRRIVYSGSPITKEALLTAMATFKCDFAQIYGMTETTGSFAQLDPQDHCIEGERAHLLRSAGRPYPWVETRIARRAEAGDCATGEVGEILTRSAQNCLGYWQKPAETQALIGADGWLRTGDAGYMDEAGYLFLTDRIKDMIISGGENVYPAEVENALAACASIAEIAVIGVPSDKWGETVKAVVVLRAGAEPDEAQVIRFAKERLAGFKCPTSVDFIKALPRSPTGKVLKKDLRAPYWVGKERHIN
jgi:long-chain acyl-CoA synthetase